MGRIKQLMVRVTGAHTKKALGENFDLIKDLGSTMPSKKVRNKLQDIARLKAKG